MIKLFDDSYGINLKQLSDGLKNVATDYEEYKKRMNHAQLEKMYYIVDHNDFILSMNNTEKIDDFKIGEKYNFDTEFICHECEDLNEFYAVKNAFKGTKLESLVEPPVNCDTFKCIYKNEDEAWLLGQQYCGYGEMRYRYLDSTCCYIHFNVPYLRDEDSFEIGLPRADIIKDKLEKKEIDPRLLMVVINNEPAYYWAYNYPNQRFKYCRIYSDLNQISIEATAPYYNNFNRVDYDASPAYYIPFFIVRKRSYFIYNSDNSRGTNQ